MENEKKPFEQEQMNREGIEREQMERQPGQSDRQPFERDAERGEDQDVALGQSHSFEEAQKDNPALRFASERTEGGSDQFERPSDERMEQDDQQLTGEGERSRF